MHEIENGKVFLVAMTPGEVSVTQLNVPLTKAGYKVEFERIAKSEHVKACLDERVLFSRYRLTTDDDPSDSYSSW